MNESNIMTKLSTFIPNTNDDLLNITLRLILNLTFDTDLRDKAVKSGLVPKLVNLMPLENHRWVSLAKWDNVRFCLVNICKSSVLINVDVDDNFCDRSMNKIFL